MAKSILVANWKNHPSSLSEAKTLLNQLSRKSRFYRNLHFFIAPPLPYLELVSIRTENFAHLASQDIFLPLRTGSYTGEVTLDILKSFGIELSILGHSERRALGETSENVCRKVKSALRAGIISLVCIGEISRDTDGEHFEFLREQLKASLRGLGRKSDVSKLIVAYEPAWAIGHSSKEAIDSSDLSQAVIFIRKTLVDIFGRGAAERIPILYGGSVEPVNAELLVRETGIRGFLIGHTSLKAKNLEAIAQSLLLK